MLKDEDKLWRYTNFTDLLYMIMYKAIPLINASKFEDNLEGYNPYKAEKEWKQNAKDYNISCWHKNEYESDAMWKLFSSDLNNAVAIQTTYKNLKDVVGESYRIEEVEYLDYEKDFYETKEPILCKRKRFEFEKEVRVVKKAEVVKHLGGVYKHTPDLILLGIGEENLKKILNKVYISPYAPFRFCEIVRHTLELYKISVPIRASNEFYNGTIL